MVGEFGILLTAPRAWLLTGSDDCLGGVEGLTGLGRLFFLENDESKLRGDTVSSDMVEAGEKKLAGDTAAAAPAPQDDDDDSVVLTQKDGLYWKLLLPGHYWVQAIHEEKLSNGRNVFSVSNNTCISIGDGSKRQQAERLDFLLMPYNQWKSYSYTQKLVIKEKETPGMSFAFLVIFLSDYS